MKLKEFYWDIKNVRVLTRNEMIGIFAKHMEEDENFDDYTSFGAWIIQSGDYEEMPRRIKVIYRKMKDYMKSAKSAELIGAVIDEYAFIKQILVDGYGMNNDEFHAEIEKLWKEMN